jgi:hypothetical protein
MFAARKAVGRVPPTALLFVALGQPSRGILILCKRHRLTVVGVGPRMSEFLHDIPNFEGSRDLSRASFLLRELRAARRSIQDQQNQTLNQHDGRHPRDGKH